MKGRINDRERLAHILKAIEVLQREAGNNDLMRLKENPIVFFGFVKNVEIIGEAAYKLSKEFKETHCDLPWKNIEGMRHVLVHGYYEISPEKMWHVVETSIPEMRPLIEAYLHELSAAEGRIGEADDES